MTAHVLTANRLSDGVVVFLTEKGWVEEIASAEVAQGSAAAAALEARGREAMALNEVVDAYLVEVVEENGAPRPAALRELLRTRGSSVRPDLGKQARQSGSADVPL